MGMTVRCHRRTGLVVQDLCSLDFGKMCRDSDQHCGALSSSSVFSLPCYLDGLYTGFGYGTDGFRPLDVLVHHLHEAGVGPASMS